MSLVQFNESAQVERAAAAINAAVDALCSLPLADLTVWALARDLDPGQVRDTVWRLHRLSIANTSWLDDRKQASAVSINARRAAKGGER